MSQNRHWEDVYEGRPPQRHGWFRPRLETSLDWLHDLELPAEAPIIDVGAGASTLVDGLLAEGYRDITVLDISSQALDVSRQRLGKSAARVTWINADITTVELPEAHYALWHDRAVLHFLVDASDRQRYVDTLRQSLQRGAHVIIGAFAYEAPPTCAGSPVRRYDLDELARTVGETFRAVRNQKELHMTPGGVEQMYLYALFRLP